MQPRIDEPCPEADLAVPVEEDFTLPPNGLVLQRVVRSIEVLAWIFRSSHLENFACCAFEIVRTKWSHWLIFLTHERNARAQGPKSQRQYFRHPQGHLAFLHRQRVTHLEPAFFHLRPLTADMAGIERDVQP